MPAMTPWAYTDDMSVPLNLARHLLAEDDANTAYLTDAKITSTLTVLGWQEGMAVLAQGLIVKLSGETTEASEAGGSTYKWADRLKGLQQVKAKADAGTLPDPHGTKKAGPTSTFMENLPNF